MATRRSVRSRVLGDREKLRQIDLHWHDLRHEGACRLLADGVDIRIIQRCSGTPSAKNVRRRKEESGGDRKRSGGSERNGRTNSSETSVLNVTEEEGERRRQGGEGPERGRGGKLRSVTGSKSWRRPAGTRTCDPRLRRPMLYPPELRARTSIRSAAHGAPPRRGGRGGNAGGAARRRGDQHLLRQIREHRFPGGGVAQGPWERR